MQVILFSYPGVTGEVLIHKHEDWISVDSIDMSCEPVAAASGYSISSLSHGDDISERSGDQSATAARLGIDSVTLHKSVDRATPGFINLAFRKKQNGIPPAIIKVLRAQDSRSDDKVQWHEPFLIMTFHEPHISSHSMAISKDSMNEVIKLSFKKLDIEYKLYRNGKSMGTSQAYIDLTGRRPAEED